MNIKQENQTYFFKGHIKAISPLTFSYKGSNYEGMQRLPRAGSRRLEDPPYLPGTSIRGLIRHSMHLVSQNALKLNGDMHSLESHFCNAQGVDITGEVINEKSSGLINQYSKLRQSNPIISIGGRWKLTGKLNCPPAFPENQDCISIYGQGARTVMFERNEPLIDELVPEDQDRLVNLLRMQTDSSIQKSEHLSSIKSLQGKIWKENSKEKKLDLEAQLNLHQKKLSALKSSKLEGGESIRRPLQGYEAFNSNTIFNHLPSLQNGTPIELGILLASFRAIARNPYLGGKQNTGGEISMTYSVSRFKNDDDDEPTEIGQIATSRNGFTLQGSELEVALNLWDNSKKDLDKNGLNLKAYKI